MAWPATPWYLPGGKMMVVNRGGATYAVSDADEMCCPQCPPNTPAGRAWCENCAAALYVTVDMTCNDCHCNLTFHLVPFVHLNPLAPTGCGWIDHSHSSEPCSPRANLECGKTYMRNTVYWALEIHCGDGVYNYRLNICGDAANCPPVGIYTRYGDIYCGTCPPTLTVTDVPPTTTTT